MSITMVRISGGMTITLRSPERRDSTMQLFAISRALRAPDDCSAAPPTATNTWNDAWFRWRPLRAGCEALWLRLKHVPDRNRHGLRFESCFGHIAPIVTVGRALLELNHRYGKLRRLPTKE